MQGRAPPPKKKNLLTFLADGSYNQTKLSVLFRYEGQILMNLMDGEGEFRWPNGDVYKGTYINGR